VVIRNIYTWITLTFSDSHKKKLSLLPVLLILPLLCGHEQDIHMLKIKCSLTIEVETWRHLYFSRLPHYTSDHSQQGPEACIFFSTVLPHIIPFTREKQQNGGEGSKLLENESSTVTIFKMKKPKQASSNLWGRSTKCIEPN